MSKNTFTARKFSNNESRTVFWMPPLSLDQSSSSSKRDMLQHTKEWLMSSLQDGPAKTFAVGQSPSQVWKVNAQDFGDATPLGSDIRNRGRTPRYILSRIQKGKQINLGMQLAFLALMEDPTCGGESNPEFQEWLMGCPIGWTGLQPLGKDGFQQWLQSHGKSYQDCDEQPGGKEEEDGTGKVVE